MTKWIKKKTLKMSYRRLWSSSFLCFSSRHFLHTHTYFIRCCILFPLIAREWNEQCLHDASIICNDSPWVIPYCSCLIQQARSEQKAFTWWREGCLLQFITDSEHGESSYISQVSLSILSAFYDNHSELLLLFWDICRNIWLTSWSFLPKRKATKYCETYLQCRKK